jgi:DNA-binding transcriptional LysR family regulator
MGRRMNLRKIDLNLLVAFDALTRERNVSRAARALGITQPALSHALKRLRALFNDPVLVRTASGMSPTTLAISLQPKIARILANVHSVLSAATEFDPLVTKRTFRIAMSDAMIIEGLPFILRNIRRTAPNINLEISSAGPLESCGRVVDDAVDLAIGVFPDLPENIQREELYRDKLLCLTDRRHKKLKHGRLSMKEYLMAPHVTVARNLDTGIQLDRILQSMGIERRIVASVPHYLAIPAVVRGTDLVAHSRKRLINLFKTSSDLVVFPIPLPLKVPDLVFLQIWHERYHDDPGHQWLRSLVLKALKADHPSPSAS